MKRIVLFCSLVSIILFNRLRVCAETLEISLDDSYVEGVITPLETERMSGEENEIQVYSFYIENPGKINLHFISHVNNMRFQIKDIDENIIEDDYIRSDNSPQDYMLTLDVGTYTLHIIKIAPTGLMGVQVSDDNVGDYKFKIEYFSIINDKNENNADGTVILGRNYEGFFQSRNNSDTVQKNHKFSVSENGTYAFTISSDMTLNYLIKDIDENVIGEGSSYNDSDSRQELALSSGTYDIICNTSEAGSYQIFIEEKVIESSNEKYSVFSQEEQKIEEDEKNNTEKSGVIEKILSPSTFIGAIVVGVISGVIVAFLTKERD